MPIETREERCGRQEAEDFTCRFGRIGDAQTGRGQLDRDLCDLRCRIALALGLGIRRPQVDAGQRDTRAGGPGITRRRFARWGQCGSHRMVARTPLGMELGELLLGALMVGRQAQDDLAQADRLDQPPLGGQPPRGHRIRRHRIIDLAQLFVEEAPLLRPTGVAGLERLELEERGGRPAELASLLVVFGLATQFTEASAHVFSKDQDTSTGAKCSLWGRVVQALVTGCGPCPGEPTR